MTFPIDTYGLSLTVFELFSWLQKRLRPVVERQKGMTLSYQCGRLSSTVLIKNLPLSILIANICTHAMFSTYSYRDPKKPFCSLSEAIAYRAVIAVVSGSDGQVADRAGGNAFRAS